MGQGAPCVAGREEMEPEMFREELGANRALTSPRQSRGVCRLDGARWQRWGERGGLQQRAWASAVTEGSEACLGATRGGSQGPGTVWSPAWPG